jgi:eukaryotic-like serine/threonine-protein kinase
MVAADAESSPALAPGSMFAGRYRVEAELGRGGMAVVYRVFDEQLGESVALKLLDHIAQGNSLERFRREVRLARRITHRNVARTYDLGESAGVHFLTMELVNGPSLKEVVAAGEVLPLGRALDLCRQVAEGLAAAHQAGIVHRDLKPANVLVDASDRAVIVDFGIARPMHDDQALTRGAIGTPLYMAPEQLSGEEVGPSSDLYALGLVLHELATGKRVAFGGSGAHAVSARLLNAPDLAPIRGVSGAVATLLEELLASEPSARPSSAHEVARRLARLDERASIGNLATGDPTLPGPPPGQPFTPPPRKQPALAVLPFRERDGDGGLGRALSEALVDVLSGLRGVQVLSAQTGEKIVAGDTLVLGRQLGADVLVEGSVQRRDQRVRVTVRLVEVASGVQLWSERFEGRIGDFVDFEETMARRIAEQLRMGIHTALVRGKVPSEAVELYLLGRAKLRRRELTGPGAAIDLLERALALAPSFEPLLAAHALARVTRWHLARLDSKPEQLLEVVASVERALEHASEIAESHLAAATLASQQGDYARAAMFLRRALLLAPTCAPAQEYLGMLQCEAGHFEEGIQRVQFALTLEPMTPLAWVTLARSHAFAGRHGELADWCAEMLRGTGPHFVVVRQLQLRVAAWSADHATVRRFLDDFHGRTDTLGLLEVYARAVLGELTRAQAEPLIQQQMVHFQSPRSRTYALQLITECWACSGELEAAAHTLVQAADEALADLEWLQCCPALEPLRPTPAYAAARVRVSERATAIWRV